MQTLAAKLSSYNLLNYLVPGTVFVVLARLLTRYDLTQEHLLLAFFVYYFVGMVISRVGSLLVSPAMQKIGLVEPAPYAEYVTAEQADPKLETLSEQNNTYRTFCAMALCLVLLKLYEFGTSFWSPPDWLARWGAVIALVLLYAFSCRKQTGYIRDRVLEHSRNGANHEQG